MNHQEMKEMFDGYMNEMEKQTAILKHLEEQQEILIEQNAKISATLGRLAEHVQITFFFLGMEHCTWHPGTTQHRYGTDRRRCLLCQTFQTHSRVPFSYAIWSIFPMHDSIISLYYPFMKEAAMPLFLCNNPLFQPMTYLTMRD